MHLTGGVAALAAAWSVGPRDNGGYTSRGDPVPMPAAPSCCKSSAR